MLAKMEFLMKYCFILLSLFMSGCITVHNPIPEGYVGPLATIDDSFKVHSSRTASMFYIQKIDGKNVLNSFSKSYDASYGKNGILVTEGHSHQLPALKIKLSLSGETVHGAPIGYILNAGSNYIVRGDIEFEPEDNKHYLISGELTKDSSAIWIENLKGNIVSDVVLVVGDSENSKIIPSSQYVREASHTANITGEKKQDRASLFSQIRGGESLALVTEKVGKPDIITYNKANFFTGRSSSVDYEYSGLGKIRFSNHDKKAENVLRVFPEVGISLDELTNPLESSGLTLQHVAKEYFKKDTLSEEELDKVAEAIWKNRHTEDNYTKDAVAWLIKVIGKQGNSRYYNLVNTLNNKNLYDNKITKYATKTLKILKPSSLNQFKYSE
jgi:hypothetical protein